MNGVSNNVQVRQPNYHATRNGAVAGAIAGGVGYGATYGAVKFAENKINNGSEAMKEFITRKMTEKLSKKGVDASNMSMPKIFEGTLAEMRKPLNIAKAVGKVAVVGTLIGFGIDAIKNSKMNKADAKVAQQSNEDKKA